MHLYTLVSKPNSLKGLERRTEEYSEAVEALQEAHPEVYRLLQMFPQCADAGNVFIINAVSSDTVNPINVHELSDKDGPIILQVGKLLVGSNGSRFLHCPRSMVQQLTDQAVWRLWAKQINDKLELEAAHKEVFKTGVDRRKNIEDLKEESSQEIKALLVG